MATVNDAPVHLRKHVSKIPDDILKRLSADELKARLRYADSFDQRASRESNPEHFRHLKMHSKKILTAQPVFFHLSELKRLNEMIGQTRRSAAREVHYALRDQFSNEKAKAALYPPGLIDAVNAAVLGKATGVDELDKLADEAIRRPVMTAENEQLQALLLGEVLTAQAQVKVAEEELNDQGIDNPSLADCLAWLNATRKERERLAMQWATMLAIGDPDWKSRTKKVSP